MKFKKKSFKTEGFCDGFSVINNLFKNYSIAGEVLKELKFGVLSFCKIQLVNAVFFRNANPNIQLQTTIYHFYK